MKPTGKFIKYLIVTMVVVFGIILVFSIKGKSEAGRSSQDLMAAMNISKIIKKVKSPDFMLENLSGETIRLSDYQGKVVLLNFWTTW